MCSYRGESTCPPINMYTRDNGVPIGMFRQFGLDLRVLTFWKSDRKCRLKGTRVTWTYENRCRSSWPPHYGSFIRLPRESNRVCSGIGNLLSEAIHFTNLAWLAFAWMRMIGLAWVAGPTS